MGSKGMFRSKRQIDGNYDEMKVEGTLESSDESD
jgi:hypothetical protein